MGSNSRFSKAALLVILCSRIGYSLDPNRTLTQYVHRIWQVQQGLPQASIYSILQTRDGFLWLGTQTGLVRFDGVRFTSLEDIYPGAPGNVWIRNLVEDSRGALWFGTNENGLFRLENGAITHYSQKEGMPSDTNQCLVAGRPGEVWACTPNGLVRFAEGSFQVFRTDNFRAACQGSDGRLRAGGDSPLLAEWNGSSFTTHALTSVGADGGVRDLICGDNGAMWIGTTNGLIGFKDGKERLYTVKDGLADNWIVDLSASRDGSLWIGTRNGFSRYRNGEIDTFHPQDGLSQSTVYSVYEDREGSLWVGTKHGLNQFLDGRAIPYTVNEGLPSNDTGPVLQDTLGNIWVGTLGAGLSRFDGRRFKVLTTTAGLASNAIYALAEDDSGGLWVGTDRGLSRLRNGVVEQTYTTGQGLPSNDVRSLFRDRAGVLWVGTSDGAAMFRNREFVQPGELGRRLRVPILAMGEDREHRLYLATAGGVHFFDGGKVMETLQSGNSLRGVDAFFLDHEGLLWMGMLGGGLRLAENGKVSTFLMRDGLFDNEIFGIVEDSHDRLWMACSKGIYSVPRADLRRFAAGEIRKVVSTPYSPTDALRVIECKSGVQPAASVMGDGRLWFSTIRGLIVLDPTHLQRNVLPPPIVIEDVIVNGEREDPNLIGTIAPGRKNLEFHYTGLSFLASSRITFRYMLENFDRNWIEAGTRREAFYTNLPPGTFRFRVTACNIDGVCNETGTSVAFALASHYYQRVWFLPLCAVSIAISVWLVYQLRIRRLRDQFSLILSERNRIARELHDTLIQGFSGITMQLQALAGRLRSPQERVTLDGIIEDAGTCLRETRRSVAGLRSGQSGAGSGLAAAIERAARQITEAKDIRLRLKLQQTPKGLPADIEYNLVRIAQEAVSNSVKHSGARTVEVALDWTSHAVHLSVKDDGSGFAREENGKIGHHYGLIGMKERASHIGANFDLASAPGRGTTVSVVLPNGNHDE